METVNVYTENGDFVTCNYCGKVMLLPCGADKCPECKQTGCLSWTDDDLQETNINGLLARHCNLRQKNNLLPEEYLSHEVLCTEFPKYRVNTDFLEKAKTLVRICPETKRPVLVQYMGEEHWLCLHNDSEEKDRSAIENWLATQGGGPPCLIPIPPHLYAAWQAGEIEMHIASLNYYRTSDNQPLGGCDNVFYDKRQAMRALVDYFINGELEKSKDIYYICEVRHFAPPLEERRTYPAIQSIWDLSGYDTVKPYYSHAVNTIHPIK